MDLVEPTLVSRWNSGRESRRHLYVIGQTGTGKNTLLLIGLDGIDYRRGINTSIQHGEFGQPLHIQPR
jgi:hypothetical protein